MRRLSTRSTAALGVALLFTTILAGCASVTSTPSPSLAATPEATPDVATVFVTQITSPDLEGTTEVTGTISVKTEGVTVDGTIEGEARFSGGDSSSSLAVDVAGTIQQTDEISIGDATYTSTDGGPYVLAMAEPDAEDGGSLTKALGGVESLEDAGPVQHFGRTVRELTPTDPIDLDPAALGFTDPTMADAVMSMAFFAEPDGTPAGFSIGMTWTQGLEGGTLAEAEIALDFEFTDLGSPVAIEVPDEVWIQWDAADAPFTVAYPDGWTSEAAFGTLLFSAPDGSELFSVSLSDPAPEHASQDAFSAASNATMASLGAVQSGSQPYGVGSVTGTLVAYRNAYADVNSLLLHLPLFYGAYGYEVQLATIAAPGEESLVQDRFDAFMSTFAFTE